MRSITLTPGSENNAEPMNAEPKTADNERLQCRPHSGRHTNSKALIATIMASGFVNLPDTLKGRNMAAIKK